MKKVRLQRPKTEGKLTVEKMRDAVMRLPEHVRTDPAFFAHYTYLSVINYFLGEEWLKRYVLPMAKRKSYLFPNFDVENGNKYYLIDVMNLADLLFNLQSVDGFDACLKPLMSGFIDSTMSELYAGMFLQQHGFGFKFVEPKGSIGDDYDIELVYPDGTIACAEVKSKPKSTKRSPETIRNALERAMGQLPENRPGIVFIKIPQVCIDDVEGDVKLHMSLIETVEQFFQNSERVVLVLFYALYVSFSQEYTRVNHALLERINTHNRFDKGRDWTLFSDEDFRDPFATRNWFQVANFLNGA